MKKAIKWIDDNAEICLIVIALVVITVVMTAQVVCRKIFNYSIPWSETLSCHMLMLICLFGVPCSIRVGNAIRFDVITTFLPEKGKKIFDIVSHLIVMVFFVMMIPAAFGIAQSMSSTIMPYMPYSMELIYGGCAVAVVLTVIRCLEVIVRAIGALKEK